ncbi:aspartic proteinase Asp1-like isoform X2 [Momordica charantia]|uniref:Aspartic proteinase Asp1-like isoform X2 n=1 Tax=Momordica charantia TaxID=3673 RepID=A0A6J1BRQ3_MOMCH|nr:aspartic proteinase Asp1-like isoform X2 [Momordica charantia]
MHSRLLFPVSILFAIFAVSFSDKFSLEDRMQSGSGSNRFASSVAFPIKGNVYPLGHFTVSVNIGNPPKIFELDIDTGSDLTWVQCDAPCTGCTLPRDKQYRPHSNAVRCAEPLCSALFFPGKVPCKNPNDQCDYDVEYADQGSSIGVLVRDLFPMRLTNGSVFAPNLGFGCGYDQKHGGSTAGVLGLGSGKATMTSQLSALGHVRNVVGHCLSGQGGGFLFFGGDLVPSSGMSWTPIMPSPGGRYSSGPAEVYFGGKAAGIRGLTLTFDSGSSYTYFNSQVYGAVLNLLKNDLKGKPLSDEPKDKTLPVCWKGTKAFRSVVDVRNFFKPLALSFTDSKNVQFQIPPEAYLIISKFGNVCFGILNGSQVGLGNVNVIGGKMRNTVGSTKNHFQVLFFYMLSSNISTSFSPKFVTDISLLDKIVVYDNERQQIGWAPANCNRPPKK